MALLVLNGGSSSVKFAAFAADAAGPPLLRGQLEGIGASPRLTIREGTQAETRDLPAGIGHPQAAPLLLQTLTARLPPLRGVGHRVVHGADRPADAERLDPELLEMLEALDPLALLHQPHNLAPIRALMAAAPQLPQVACYDTAFHRGQPPLATRFAIPRALHDAGIRRYGFHGLSYAWLTERLAALDPVLAAGRVVAAHLGNGASLCAMAGGRSVATSMGFTALDGLMMGTRCGALDAGVVLHLMERHGMDRAALEALLYRQSGLLGVSGISQDMRLLRASAAPEAAEAVALFVHRVVIGIGGMAAALGGVDGIVFTGGIGEHDAATRAGIAAGCAWLGLALDPARNAAGHGLISAEGAKLRAWVIPADEERMIARLTAGVLAG